jgi:hypothetical protein
LREKQNEKNQMKKRARRDQTMSRVREIKGNFKERGGWLPPVLPPDAKETCRTRTAQDPGINEQQIIYQPCARQQSNLSSITHKHPSSAPLSRHPLLLFVYLCPEIASYTSVFLTH